MTKGLSDAVQNSKGEIKSHIVNIVYDEDIINYSASDIVDELFFYLNGSKENKEALTHVLFDNKAVNVEEKIQEGSFDNQEIYNDAKIIREAFSAPRL